MLLKELREITKDLPDESELCFIMQSGCCGDTEDLNIFDLEASTYKNNTFLRFYFEALPGYKTCRQVAGTLKADEQYHKLKE